MLPTKVFRKARHSFTTYRKLVAAMLGDPDVLENGYLICSFCHKEKSHCSKCAENLAKNGTLPMSQLRRDYATRSKLLVVEGNIGVGKTTLAKKLADVLGYKMILEPTSENPYLESFYADPHKFALKLQLWILNQRYLAYVEAVQHILSSDQGVILDRSVYSDDVFAKVCTNEGFISNEGYTQYLYWRERCLKHLPPPHVTIFLDASPQCCYDRIQSRGRDCESGLSLDYLEKIHKQYLEFIDQLQSRGSSVLRYNWSVFKDEKMVCDAIVDVDTTKWMHTPIPTLSPMIEFSTC